MRQKNRSHLYLNREEKEILSSFENFEWKSVKSVEKEKKLTRKIATKTLRKAIS